MAVIERLGEPELPGNMKAEWTELMYIEKTSRSTGWDPDLIGSSRLRGVRVHGVGRTYESWTLPLAVILVVPVCVVSFVTGITIAGSYLTDAFPGSG